MGRSVGPGKGGSALMGTTRLILRTTRHSAGSYLSAFLPVAEYSYWTLKVPLAPWDASKSACATPHTAIPDKKTMRFFMVPPLQVEAESGTKPAQGFFSFASMASARASDATPSLTTIMSMAWSVALAVTFFREVTPRCR